MYNIRYNIEYDQVWYGTILYLISYTILYMPSTILLYYYKNIALQQCKSKHQRKIEMKTNWHATLPTAARLLLILLLLVFYFAIFVLLLICNSVFVTFSESLSVHLTCYHGGTASSLPVYDVCTDTIQAWNHTTRNINNWAEGVVTDILHQKNGKMQAEISISRSDENRYIIKRSVVCMLWIQLKWGRWCSTRGCLWLNQGLANKYCWPAWVTKDFAQSHVTGMERLS